MRRKTLIVCRPCHDVHPREPRRARGISHWRAQCTERCPLGSEGGCAEKAQFNSVNPGPRRAAHPVTLPGEQVAVPCDELLDGFRGPAGDFLDRGGHAVIPVLAV